MTQARRSRNYALALAIVFGFHQFATLHGEDSDLKPSDRPISRTVISAEPSALQKTKLAEARQSARWNVRLAREEMRELRFERMLARK